VQYRTPGEELKTAEGPEVLVGVASLLAAEPDAADIRDIKPPLVPPFDWRPYALVGAALAAALLVLGGLYYLVNRPRRQYTSPPPPAHEVALAALARLRQKRLLDEGKLEEFYVQLSSIIRRYLEDRFALRAPEMTTEEFLSVTAQDRRLSAPQRRLLSDFLSQADLVKFARHLPTLADTEGAYDAGRRFVEETSPAPSEETRAAA
jgi:hypothetical protein